jgi:hypothetical protein
MPLIRWHCHWFHYIDYADARLITLSLLFRHYYAFIAHYFHISLRHFLSITLLIDFFHWHFHFIWHIIIIISPLPLLPLIFDYINIAIIIIDIIDYYFHYWIGPLIIIAIIDYFIAH